MGVRELAGEGVGPHERECILRVDLPVWAVRLILHLDHWEQALPRWPLAVLRGLLGYGLGGPEDPLFAQVFKQPWDGGWRFPRPFLFDGAIGGGAGRDVNSVMRFFGTGSQWIMPCLKALKARERHGFNGVPYQLETEEVVESSVPWAADWRPSGSRRWLVELLTPTRLKLFNADVGAVIAPEDVADPGARRWILHAVVWAAIRRLLSPFGAHRDCGVAVLYGKAEPIDPPLEEAVKQLLNAADITSLNLFYAREEWRGKDVGGFVGRFEVEGPAELERIFASASLTAIGQSTAFGCGRIRFETL
jgi:hypothetical protein